MTLISDDVIGCVLAGGLSRRMGGVEKATITLANQPLVNYSLEKLQKQCSVQIVNANTTASHFLQTGLPIVPDQIKGHAGPLAGIHAGLLWMIQHMPQKSALISVACDTPFFPNDLVKRLCENHYSKEAIIIAQSLGRGHPVFALWPVSIFSALDEWLREKENRKMMNFIERFPHRFVSFDSVKMDDANTVQEADPFFNINTENDLLKAQKLFNIFN